MSELERLAEATPETRDRTMDLLRAASILAVVFGHWFIGIISWRGGIIRDTSAIGVTSYLWLATWAFEVMPIFFFVGGFSNAVAFGSYERRGAGTLEFIRSRLQRLLRPSLMFVAVWGVVQIGLHLANIGAPAGPILWGDTRLLRGVLPPGATIPFGPLWFLAVYLIVVCIAPWTVRLDRRFRWWVPAFLVAGAVVVDVIGFGFEHPEVRWLNVAFVLLLPHQMGHRYAAGEFGGRSRAAYWTMVGVGLGGLVILTNPWVFRFFGEARFDWFPTIGYYPKSLLGTDIEPISNAYPPTVCFLLGDIWSLGAVMLIRPALGRWLQRAKAWRFTIAVNGVIMTLFLWHMTAYLLVILALWPLGFGHQTDSTARWWGERVVWEVIPATVLMGIVAVLGRFERPRSSRE